MTPTASVRFDVSQLSSAAQAALRAWLAEPPFVPWRAATEALLATAGRAEIQDAFGSVLSFGTGGMRGPCGPGPGRMNGWVVARASQGLADYLRARPALPASVVVGCDARLDSRAFAEITARTLAAAGLTVHLHDGLVSTPQLSFAVRALGVGAGVMITASHNPPGDNGYKCYQAAGHQFAPPEDAELVACVDRAAPPTLAELASLESLRADGRVRSVPPELAERYLDAAVRASRLEQIPAAARAAVSILYSPYHGVGTLSVLPALRRAGFRVRVLECQARPDGRFPTLPGGVANPEEPATFWRLLCAATDADDLLLASDPDADRIGALIRGGPGGGPSSPSDRTSRDWFWLDGQRLMALLADFAARHWAAAQPTRTGVVSRSLVTTGLVDAVARAAGVAIVEGGFLVGLKYTGRLIAQLDGRPGQEFVFGGEEAHGYLSGSHVRDKDAANAACLLAGLVAECKAAGRSVWSHLLGLYRRHGVYGHAAGNLSLSLADGGAARATRILDRLRREPPTVLAGRPVLRAIDFRGAERIELSPSDGRELRRQPSDPGNVLVYELSVDGGDRLTVRPSGTEPKMKLYAQLVRPMLDSASDAAVEAAAAAAEIEATELLTTVMGELRRL